MRGRVRVTCSTLVICGLAACSGNGSPAPSTSTSTTTTAPERFARGEPDGVLTIGVLLPRTGGGATLGEPLVNVVNAAVAAVNAAGGVNGRDVVVRLGDEGSDPSSASIGADDLLGGSPSIDAMIGPASSRAAAAVLPTITAAGVATCSPTATSIALTGLPDQQLFFRTVPSDTVEAQAMAQVINETGRGSVGLVFTDDVYGRPFANAVRAALMGRSVQIVSELSYSAADDDYSQEAAELVAKGPPVVAVIGDTASGGRMVAALLEAGGNDPLIVANDAIRRADFGSSVDPDELRDRVSGVSVSAYEGRDELLQILGSEEPGSEGLASAAFASAAVDCVNLLALGATLSSPDDAAAIGAEAIEVSVGGVVCETFADCRASIDEGLKVDYNGPTGRLELDSNGDVKRASYDVYGFDDAGDDVTMDEIVVTGS